MNVFDELRSRGLIAQMTDEEEIRKLLSGPGVSFYIGFDPTADSLHVGHMLQLIVMAHLQRAGHRPIAIIGGGTAMVGDPTGRSDMRQMLTPEQIRHNGECFVSQMKNLVDFSEGKAIMLNNADWLLELNYVQFLREVGVHFSVNRMLTFECFKSRLERGLSFIEFNYMLMQSYDFLELFRKFGCLMQLGGDDQWANILGGTELIRRVTGKDAYGMTFTLLTTSDGKKMGKTQSGAIWLDPNKTTPFEFFQYWRNVQDDDVVRLLKMITFVPLEEIAAFEGLRGNELNMAKQRLAYEVTKLVHGQDEADKAQASALALFSAGAEDENMPSTVFSAEDFAAGALGVPELLVRCGLAPSKGEARRLMTQGGVELDGVKAADPAATISPEDFKDGRIIIKKGKKTFHRAELK